MVLRRSRMGLFVVCAIVALGGTPARADRARDDRAVEILLRNLDAGESTGDLVKKVVTELRADPKECPAPRVEGGRTVSDCIHVRMSKITKLAFDSGKLDRVERAVLTRVFSMAVVTKDDVKIDLELDPGARGKGIEQPAVLNYRERKKQFQALRKAKGLPEVLDPSLAERVEEAYFRKMKGLGSVGAGRIGPEEYLAARFNRIQLNVLSGMLTTLIDRMNHSSGRILLDRPDFASRAARAEILEQELVDLALRLAFAEAQETQQILAEIAAKRTELASERSGLEADALFIRLQTKKGERDLAIGSLLAPGLEAVELQRRAGEVERLDNEVKEIEAKLAEERNVLPLAPSDVDRIAVKALKIELREATERGAFRGVNLSLGDVVMAAWVSGEIDSELLEACLDTDPLKEPREKFLVKVASRAWRIGQAVAMINPTSAYAVTIASVVLASIEQKKETKRRQADEGSLVRE
jgi:hypothetical protein